jgi:phosphoribosylformylglycinamidine synthase
VCDAPVEVITAGIEHRRPERPRAATSSTSAQLRVADHAAFLSQLIASPNLGSRDPILRYYDTEVQARMALRAGEADASVLVPVPGAPLGAAITVDGNPWYVAADPYWGTAHVVYEALRNLVAVGARPVALTDCLNFGNPEDPEVFEEFVRSVRGLGDAARALGPKGESGPPVPIVSGNVSFYNESSTGRSIEPSPIVAALGVLDDYSVAVSSGLKRAGAPLYLTGPRQSAMGASQAQYLLTGEKGGALPSLDFEAERRRLHVVLEAVRRGLALACHDISDGGLAMAAFEMALGGSSAMGLGLEVRAPEADGVAIEARLYGEAPGFLLEIAPERESDVTELFRAAGVDLIQVGATLAEPRLRIMSQGETLVDADLAELARIHSDAIRPYVE